jgi:vesicle-fusing ATPase
MLSKIDGVESLNNILIIGMTNRKDMIDPALLRPGRLEVHIEIGLPDEKGRKQIFLIHTRRMRENNLMASDVDLEKLAKLSKNFSGAEIEGLVKSAASYALYGNVDVTKGAVTGKTDLKNIKITMEHFLYALSEVIPAFGVAEEDLKNCLRHDLIQWSDQVSKAMQTGQVLVRQVATSAQTPLLSVLIEGKPGSGKTALAAKLALESGFPYVKLISPEQFVDVSERGKCSEINKVFEDAYKSNLSLIILDDVERLLEYVPIGPRFSNAVLQTLLVLLKKVPPHENRRVIIMATTSSMQILEDMQMQQVFNVILHMPQLTKPQHVKQVFTGLSVPVEGKELDRLAEECFFPISAQQLLMLIEMARQDGQTITASRFRDCAERAGLDRRKKKDKDGADDLS